MEPIEALIDSDLLIDASRGVQQATDWLVQHQHQHLALSVVTEIEVLVGCRNRAELNRVERMLRHYTALPLNARCSATATELVRRYTLSHGLALADALIAATALTYSVPLATKNQRDFRFITGFRLLPYPA